MVKEKHFKFDVTGSRLGGSMDFSFFRMMHIWLRFFPYSLPSLEPLTSSLECFSFTTRAALILFSYDSTSIHKVFRPTFFSFFSFFTELLWCLPNTELYELRMNVVEIGLAKSKLETKMYCTLRCGHQGVWLELLWVLIVNVFNIWEDYSFYTPFVY